MSLVQRMIRRHMQALLSELQAHGVDAIAVTGGVLLAPEPDGKNRCHVFVMTDGQITTTDAPDEDVDQNAICSAMMLDVGKCLMKHGKENQS